MKKISFLVVLMVLTMTVKWANADINVCDNFEYPKNMEVFGKDIKELGENQFIFDREENGISYYRLLCPRGYFHQTPTNQEQPRESEIFWGFVEVEGKSLAYMRSTQFKATKITTTLFLMTKNLGKEPKVKLEDMKEIYVWHTPDGLTSKVKADEEEDMLRIKINQYLDRLRPVE